VCHFEELYLEEELSVCDLEEIHLEQLSRRKSTSKWIPWSHPYLDRFLSYKDFGAACLLIQTKCKAKLAYILECATPT
jgi:hypothetical protein